LNTYISGKPVSGGEPGAEDFTMLCKICFFVGKDHRVDNNVKALLTVIAPRMRQMATRTISPPSTANVAPIIVTPETDTHRKVRIALGNLQENPKLKLRNNFRYFHRITKSD
jgi:hypothetical protein